MLKYRILTAIVLIPLFLALLFLTSPLWFSLLTALLVIVGGWEWSSLMGIKKQSHRFIYPIILAGILVASIWLPIIYTLVLSFFWWLTALWLVIIYPKLSRRWGRGLLTRGVMGLFVLVPCWLAINVLRNADNGLYLLLFLFILIWGADTGAYFVGKKWGKTKLAPAVSPGKSYQGLYGALLTTGLITVIFLCWARTPYPIWPELIGLSLITILFSVLGDLFESMLKRNVGLKDSSNLLPGHGGILDRIDSLTSAAPIFVLGMLIMQKILFEG